MTRIRIAAFFGFLAVALGALGAHKLQPELLANGTLPMWEKAAHYHLVHSVVLLVLALWSGTSRITWHSFVLGILFFSGSLYAYSLTPAKSLMYLTPVGGILLLVGWLSIILMDKGSCFKKKL